MNWILEILASIRFGPGADPDVLSVQSTVQTASLHELSFS